MALSETREDEGEMRDSERRGGWKRGSERERVRDKERVIIPFNWRASANYVPLHCLLLIAPF